MGFKLMNFKAGKDKAPSVKEAAASKIAILEEQVNGKTKKLAEAEQQIKKLAAASQEPEERVGPHGPLVELEVEPSSGQESAESTGADAIGEVTAAAPAQSAAVAKMEDIPPAPPPPAPPAATADAASNDASLSNLFSQEEEDENPLAALINSLPNVSAKELVNDLNEIKSIIREMPHR